MLSRLSRRLPRLLRKGRVGIILGWVALVFAFTQTTTFRSFVPIQRLEQSRLDWKFKNRGHESPHPAVRVVGITATALDSALLEKFAGQSEAIRLMQGSWPWNRKVWALLIDRLFEMGAKTVALDILFPGEREGNDDLQKVIEKYPGRVVIGSTVLIESKEDNQRTMIVPHQSIVGDDPWKVTGLCVLHEEIDGVIRRVNYVTTDFEEQGVDDPNLKFMAKTISSFAPFSVEKFLGHKLLPVRDQLINYQGPPGTYQYIPIEEVFMDSVINSGPRAEGGNLFKDKLVFVGPIAETFHDAHSTPFGSGKTAMPGVEIHAQIAGSILSNHLLTDASSRLNLAIALAVAVASAVAVIVARQVIWQVVILVALFASVIVVAQWAFAAKRLVIPDVTPLFEILTIGSISVIFQFALSQMETARIRSTFNRYVAKNVVNIIVERADAMEQMLLGEKKCVTILFSDVRGFTTIFESSDATNLVAQLNEYFRAMVDIILREGGTLQKYIGDAIMAGWGDTHSLGDDTDATRAVRTALEMRKSLERLNTWWATAPDRLQFNFGIGINHGEVVVGDIGHPDQREFTVLGDAINSAARFESATKQFHVDILVGESVEKLTGQKFVYRRVDRAKFKGKTKPIEVYTPLSEASVPAPPWLAQYHEAIALYRSQKFTEAINEFRFVNQKLGGDDFLCQMYVDRCTVFLKSPPPADWDGSYTLSEK